MLPEDMTTDLIYGTLLSNPASDLTAAILMGALRSLAGNPRRGSFLLRAYPQKETVMGFNLVDGTSANEDGASDKLVETSIREAMLFPKSYYFGRAKLVDDTVIPAGIWIDRELSVISIKATKVHFVASVRFDPSPDSSYERQTVGVFLSLSETFRHLNGADPILQESCENIWKSQAKDNPNLAHTIRGWINSVFATDSDKLSFVSIWRETPRDASHFA